MLKAAGRAPMEPMRRLRKPRTMRHTAENHARSLAKLSELGAEVWSDVMEYGMPYCIRLLQADIFPQKLSRRSEIFMSSVRSGVACTSTGTCSVEWRMASTMPRSSPKFGSVTMMPSISSRCLRKSSAQRRASSGVSTAPNFDCSGVSAMTRTPAFSSTPIIASLPSLAR